MGKLIVYSFKVDEELLGHAKKFLARQGVQLQDSLGDFIEVAADCEQGIKLHEEDTSISEMQVALATFVQILRLYHRQMQGRMVSEQPSSGSGDKKR